MLHDEKEPWEELLRQFVSYVLVGGGGAMVEWLCFGGLVYWTGVSYMWSTIIAFVVGIYCNWQLGRAITFRDVELEVSLFRELCQVFLAGVIGLILNIMLMYGMVEYYHMEKLAAKITATFVVFFWNFMVRKYYIYKI